MHSSKVNIPDISSAHPDEGSRGEVGTFSAYLKADRNLSA